MTTDNGLLAGFSSAWQLVQHGSEHHIRLHLTNLKTARAVCLHLAADLDKLIRLAELRLEEHASLARDVRAFEKHCVGPAARRQ
jgi:hypothetical protein